jgi:spore germination cell wall hydrolase CwlJ-like protein
MMHPFFWKRSLPRLVLWLAAAAVQAAPTREERAVAAVIMGEARGEGFRGMTAVGEVIAAPRQFSCLNRTTLAALERRHQADAQWPVALGLSLLVCRNPCRLPGYTKGANHFHRIGTRPRWAQGQKPVATIGRHVFYHLPP